jgi:aspartyl protease family protein
MQKTKIALFFICLCVIMQAWAAIRVNVVGLFSNKVVVMINGNGPHSLAAGQTKNGVKLISADSTAATFLIEGKRQVLGMGQAVSIGSSATPSLDGSVNNPINLYADSQGHFFGNLTLMGCRLNTLLIRAQPA